ncbi:MAG TPA: type II secretion system F family protein [Bdellovibrionales bacterium]|nr:type II secretion system F family protein [Bdellovibrionales bacterium]
MGFIFGDDRIFIPLFGIVVFIFAYFSADRILDFLHRKSLGGREEILELMKRMFIETDHRKVTYTLLLCSFGVGALVFFLAWPHVVLGLCLGGAMTYVGWIAPKFAMNYMWEKRCTLLTNQMVDGMTIMANGIGAGQSLTQAMERVVQNMNGPLPQEFALVLGKVRLGMSVEEALNEFGERVPRQDVQMFVTAVNILKETGGNLAETFQTIVSTVRERQKVEKKIEALTAQGTMQAVIITLVPLMLLGVFLVLDPNYVKPLFTTPLGWVCLALMLTLQIIGLFVMKKIVTIKV